MSKKKSPFVIRAAYGPKERFGDIGDLGKSLTKQSFTAECDINNILRKYQKTGALDHVNKHEAIYGFATSHDFQSALEIIRTGQTMFDELPSSIRTKFENDPAKFLDFVQDKNNQAEMVELGLAHTIQQDQNTNTTAKKGEAQIPGGDAKKSEAISEPSGTAKSGSEGA